MNTTLDNAEKWLNDLGIPTERLAGYLTFKVQYLEPLGISSTEAISELRTAMSTKRLVGSVIGYEMVVSFI